MAELAAATCLTRTDIPPAVVVSATGLTSSMIMPMRVQRSVTNESTSGSISGWLDSGSLSGKASISPDWEHQRQDILLGRAF